eukprot:TRINITY_DN2994_c0_g1_i1.p1 TRINITY_DN2994_c0_g1~~TRINITY_DN2994_c0_g1_i1.p1  ORF type:complete len:1099 (+),score=403.38 TRINITY_DN2994_c0_g1_i1:139-3297(+)
MALAREQEAAENGEQIEGEPKPDPQAIWNKLAGQKKGEVQEKEKESLGPPSKKPMLENPQKIAPPKKPESMKTITNVGPPIAPAAKRGEIQGNPDLVSAIFRNLTGTDVDAIEDEEDDDEEDLDNEPDGKDNDDDEDDDDEDDDLGVKPEGVSKAPVAKEADTPENRALKRFMAEQKGKEEQKKDAVRQIKRNIIKQQEAIAKVDTVPPTKSQMHVKVDKQLIVDALQKVERLKNSTGFIEGTGPALSGVGAMLSGIMPTGLRSPETCSMLESMQDDLIGVVPGIVKAMMDPRPSQTPNPEDGFSSIVQETATDSQAVEATHKTVRKHKKHKKKHHKKKAAPVAVSLLEVMEDVHKKKKHKKHKKGSPTKPAKTVPVGAIGELGIKGEPTNDEDEAKARTQQMKEDEAEALNKAKEELKRKLGLTQPEREPKEKFEKAAEAIAKEAADETPPEPDYNARPQKQPDPKEVRDENSITRFLKNEDYDAVKTDDLPHTPITKDAVDTLKKKADKRKKVKAGSQPGDVPDLNPDTGEVDLKAEIQEAKKTPGSEPDIELADGPTPEEVATKAGYGKNEQMGLRKQVSEAMMRVLQAIWKSNCHVTIVQYLKTAFKVLPSPELVKAVQNGRDGKFGNLNTFGIDENSPVTKRKTPTDADRMQMTRMGVKGKKQLALGKAQDAQARLISANAEIKAAKNELEDAEEQEDDKAIKRAEKILRKKNRAAKSADEAATKANENSKAKIPRESHKPLEDLDDDKDLKAKKEKAEQKLKDAEVRIANLTRKIEQASSPIDVLKKAKAANLDCKSELEVWRYAWSMPKKEICCGHFVLCQDSEKKRVKYPDGKETPYEPEPTAAEYIKEHGLNCMAEQPVWKYSWSPEKVDYCCKTGRVMCPDPDVLLKQGMLPNKTSNDSVSRLPNKFKISDDDAGTGGVDTDVYSTPDASFDPGSVENADDADADSPLKAGKHKAQMTDLRKQTGKGDFVDYVNSSSIIDGKCVIKRTEEQCVGEPGCEWLNDGPSKVTGSGACRPKRYPNKPVNVAESPGDAIVIGKEGSS